MALFRQSTITLASAQARIADSIGSSGDAESLVRAGYALEAAFQRWNIDRPWNFLLLIASGIKVLAPYTVASCTTTLNSAVMFTTGSFTTSGVAEGDLVFGTGLEPETTVLSLLSATGLSMSRTATSGATQTVTFGRRDFALPGDFGSIYSVRTVNDPRTLRPVTTREYDRSTFSQVSTGQPEAYSLLRVGEVGKVRIIPTPSAADTLVVKYYRLMDPTASPLDIPMDYEGGLIAMAKANLIADRGGDESRLAYWTRFSEMMLQKAISRNAIPTDLDLAFQPGGMTAGWNPNATQPFIDLLGG